MSAEIQARLDAAHAAYLKQKQQSEQQGAADAANQAGSAGKKQRRRGKGGKGNKSQQPPKTGKAGTKGGKGSEDKPKSRKGKGNAMQQTAKAAKSGGAAQRSERKGNKPAVVAQGNKPAVVAQGNKPAVVAQGNKPAAAAQGNKPAAAAQGNEPAVAAQGFSVANCINSTTSLQSPKSSTIQPTPAEPLGTQSHDCAHQNDGTSGGDMADPAAWRTYLSTLQTSAAVELAQLRRRCVRSFEVMRRDDNGLVAVKFALRATDPDLRFPLLNKEMHMVAEVPADYPNAAIGLWLTNPEVPPKLREQVKLWTGTHCILRVGSQMLKWMDNNLDKLLVEISLSPPVQPARPVKQAPPDKPSTDDREKVSNSTDGWCVDLSSTSNAAAAEEKEEATVESDEDSDEGFWYVRGEEDKESLLETKRGPRAAAVKKPNVRRGTEALGREMRMSGIGILKPTTLRVECLRCKIMIDVALSGDAVTRECSRCHATLEMGMVGEMAHQYSDVLALLSLNGCRAVQMMPSHFEASCMYSTSLAHLVTTVSETRQQCDKSDLILKNVAVASLRETSCSECHNKLTLLLPRVDFVDCAAGGTAQTLLSKTNKAEECKREGGNLPNNGACKHYAKSFRWLRFPCCQRAFPCDICHEEANEDGHEMVWATRMICGFCGKEQNFNQTGDCSCGARMTKSRSRHWEGGDGCRNGKLMSKTDSRKYAGMNKTIAKKKGGAKPRKHKE